MPREGERERGREENRLGLGGVELDADTNEVGAFNPGSESSMVLLQTRERDEGGRDRLSVYFRLSNPLSSPHLTPSIPDGAHLKRRHRRVVTPPCYPDSSHRFLHHFLPPPSFSRMGKGKRCFVDPAGLNNSHLTSLDDADVSQEGAKNPGNGFFQPASRL